MTNRVQTTRNGEQPPTNAISEQAVSWEHSFRNWSDHGPLRIDEICESLFTLTGGWPKCVSGVLCYAQGNEVRTLGETSALFAWIASQARINWKRGPCLVSKEEFFKRLLQRESWDWATPHPHFPAVPGVLYLSKPPRAEATGKLDELVKRFRPKTAHDAELIKALILTLYWGGPPGQRPQFAVVADESNDAEGGRGTGKSKLGEYLAELVGGCIDLDPCGSRERVISNLLSPSSWHRRVVLIDNLKMTRYSNDLLEKLITRREITGHRLFKGFARRPNLLTWMVTGNGATFSTDMAQRSVVIRLDRPSGVAQDWDTATLNFIEQHREEIVADIRWQLELKEPASLQKVDRWGPWDLDVLSRFEAAGALLEHIKTERTGIDADKEDIALTLDHLRACIDSYFRDHDGEGPIDVDGSIVWAPTAWCVQALRLFKKGLTDRERERFLTRLASSPCLRKADQNSQRGYLWTGKDVDPEHPPAKRVIVYRPEIPFHRKK